MKFDDWKNENDIARVCNELLDNADMDYSFKNCPLSIEFTFFVVGSDIKVKFKCGGISKLNIEKEFDDLPLHLVLETNVQERNGGFRINMLPEFIVDLECTAFDWSIEEFSSKERSGVYSHA